MSWPRKRLRTAVALCVLAAAAAAQSRQPKDLAAGKLLVASANVPGGRFQRAVILLVGYSAGQGAAGLVLTQPDAQTLAQVFGSFPSARGRSDKAYWGGPVEPKKIFCLLHLGTPLHEARAVLPHVYFSTNPDLMHLALNAQQPASAFRVYLGYAGWTAAKLKQEMAAGLWYVFPASAAVVFDPDPATLWARLIAQTEPKRPLPAHTRAPAAARR